MPITEMPRRFVVRPTGPIPYYGASRARHAAATSTSDNDNNGWIIGWKTANLLFRPADKMVLFLPIFQYGIIREVYVDRTAECGQWAHTAPDLSCGCGNNAFLDRQTAERFLLTQRNYHRNHEQALYFDNPVILRVGLWGNVLEDTQNTIRRYRGQHQRVANVFVPRSCGVTGCSGTATVLGQHDKPADNVLSGTYLLRPLCQAHSLPSPTKLSLKQCTNRINVPFDWSD